jgi:C-terminal processing protease CtpA/Prc
VFAACTCHAATLTNSLITAWQPAGCNGSYPPAYVNAFLPTDTEAVAFFRMSAVAVNDQGKIEFYDPQGTLIRAVTIGPVSQSGNYCFNARQAIAGSAQTSALGLYTVKGYWNDSPIFTLQYWVQNPGLTMEQKVFDFQVLASLYAKRYAPYDWKKAAFQYDALDLQPWLERINATTGDVDYFDILVQYVAALHDTHSAYTTPSDFWADLWLRVDGYFDDSGTNYAILIDSINRTFLPAATYPFQTGDELLTVDGVKVSDLVEQFKKYASAANPDTALHYASSMITQRYQYSFPKAHEIGPTAVVEIKRQPGGTVEKYTLPWWTGNTVMNRVGPVPMPKASRERSAEADAAPPYLRTLMKYRNEGVENVQEILNDGSLTPVWSRPDGFQQRLGRTSADYFYSGVVATRGFNIGYLRIPNFGPSSQSAALRQLDTEIAYLQDNTDGLVLDVMHNNGGDPCYGEEVLRRIMPNNWRALGRQIRPVWDDISNFQYDLYLAGLLGADAGTKALIQARLNDILQAYEEGRSLTPAVSVCSPSSSGSLDRTPASVVYKKPILLLVDELSTSTADGFSAQFQDNQRGKLFGWRTNGAGGSVLSFPAGFYAEGGTATVVNTMHFRPNPISTPEYPTANYVENIGVRPDIVWRYMTAGNVLQSGKPFVDAFLDAIAAEIQKSQP